VAGPPLWTIQRNDARVFILGVRPGARDSSWITGRIDAAIAESDELWRETPPEDEVVASPLLPAFALSTLGPLSDQLDAPTRERVDDAAERLSIDRPALEPLRPWVVAQLLQQATLQRAGIPPEQNMDVVLTRLAEEYGATIRYEFDVAGILRMFGDLPKPGELSYLHVILDAVEGGSELIDEGFRAWLSGDRSLDELGDADMRLRYPDFYMPLIRDRNRAWPSRIDDMLGRPGTRFVAIGCGHLAGPDSVVALLERIDGHVEH
jgi:uncharacterized protein YbaP (TraB family)